MGIGEDGDSVFRAGVQHCGAELFWGRQNGIASSRSDTDLSKGHSSPVCLEPLCKTFRMPFRMP